MTDLLECSRGFTLALWVSMDQPLNGLGILVTAGTKRINGDISGFSLMQYPLTRNLGVIVRTFRGGEEWRWEAHDIPFTFIDTWAHVAFTWHEETQLVFYINGNIVKRINKGRKIQGAGSARDTLETGTLRISNETDGHNDALLDHLEIWTHAKSEEDVRRFFSGGKSWYILVMQVLFM